MKVVKIISEKEVTAIGTEIQRIIKECYKYMPTNWTTWKKMDNYFLQIYNLLRLKQEELENLRLITNYQGNWSINKTNTLQKITPNKPKSKTRWLQDEFYRTFKENYYVFFSNFSKKKKKSWRERNASKFY